MRLLLPLLLVAGCGSDTSKTMDMQSAMTMDLAVARCSRTLADYCALQPDGSCVQTLAAAQQPSSWCPDGGTISRTVTLQHCAGSQIVIVASYIDNSDHFVYDASGALVAVFSALPHQDLSCSGGPASFAAPTGCDSPTTLCA